MADLLESNEDYGICACCGSPFWVNNQTIVSRKIGSNKKVETILSIIDKVFQSRYLGVV